MDSWGEEGPTMTLKRGKPVNRMKHCVVLYSTCVIAPCVGMLMLRIGVNVDFVTTGLQTVVSDVILHAALAMFMVEFVLEVIYRDRRAPFFRCWLAFHGLVTLVLFGLWLTTLAVSHRPEVLALQPLRLIVLLRVADIFSLIHRYQIKMATDAPQSRRAFAMLLVQGCCRAVLVAYFIAILFRVKSISFGDDQFQSASGTFLLMLPLSLLYSAESVFHSLQIAKAKDRGRTSWTNCEREIVLDNEESNEEVATEHMLVTRSLEEWPEDLNDLTQSTRTSTLNDLTLVNTKLADVQGVDLQFGLFEAEVADNFWADAQDADPPCGVVIAKLPFQVQDKESCFSAVLPDPLQSHEPMTELLGLSEAIAASKAGKTETVRLAL